MGVVDEGGLSSQGTLASLVSASRGSGAAGGGTQSGSGGGGGGGGGGTLFHLSLVSKLIRARPSLAVGAFKPIDWG
jgi:hypothetical protein